MGLGEVDYGDFDVDVDDNSEMKDDGEVDLIFNEEQPGRHRGHTINTFDTLPANIEMRDLQGPRSVSVGRSPYLNQLNLKALNMQNTHQRRSNSVYKSGYDSDANDLVTQQINQESRMQWKDNLKY